MTEAQLQQQIIIKFKNEYQRFGKGLIFSVPNEATFKNSKLQNTGVLAGVSDLIMITKNKIQFLELKVGNNKQSEKQKKFQKNIENLGFEYKIIRSVDEYDNLQK